MARAASRASRSSSPRLKLQPAHAVEFLSRSLMAEADKSVTLACLGPLTNIAMALVMEPRIARKIDKIVLMGGAQKEGGNITATASFNIYCDPHAAHVVLTSGLPVVLVNLDLTHQLVMTRARLAAIAGIGNSPGGGDPQHADMGQERRLRDVFGRGGWPAGQRCQRHCLSDRSDAFLGQRHSMCGSRPSRC